MTMTPKYKLHDGNFTISGGNDSDDRAFRPEPESNALYEVAPVVLVMILTLIGNSVLLFSLCHKRSRRIKRVNVFIVNLAIADLTVAFISMTTEILEAAFHQWVLGAFLCKFLLYLQVVTLSSTTFLLTGMSIDRYQVIVKPLQSLAQRPKIRLRVVIAWLLAFIISIPQLFIFVEVTSTDSDTGVIVRTCRSHGYNAEWQRKFHFTFLTFYTLLLPGGIMLYCYISIAKVIWTRGQQNQGKKKPKKKRPSTSPRMSVRRNVISNSRRKVVFMTLSVIIAYLVCLTPYFIFSLIRIYSDYSMKMRDELTVSKIIFQLHSALNPILYGMFTLRKEHITSICSRMSRARSRGSENKVLTEPGWSKLRKGFLFLKSHASGEASVIIANHAAKEETNLKLRNQDNGKHTTFRPLPVHHHMPGRRTDRGVQHNSTVGPADNHLVSIHTSPNTDSGTEISDV